MICAKSWGAISHYGDWEPEKAIRAGLKHWIVNDEIMARTNNACFMHCLPVRRNIEVTDGVLDSPSSIVIQEARQQDVRPERSAGKPPRPAGTPPEL